MFGVDDVERVLPAIVQGRENYIYHHKDDNGDLNCVYTDEHELPSCLVAQVADRLGLPRVSSDSPFNGMPISAVEGQSLWPWRGAFDTDAIALLSAIQSRQDCGTPWGRAVREARTELS